MYVYQMSTYYYVDNLGIPFMSLSLKKPLLSLVINQDATDYMCV